MFPFIPHGEVNYAYLERVRKRDYHWLLFRFAGFENCDLQKKQCECLLNMLIPGSNPRDSD